MGGKIVSCLELLRWFGGGGGRASLDPRFSHLKRSVVVCVYIRPFLIVKMKSLVVSSAGLYCKGCTGEGESSLELVLASPHWRRIRQSICRVSEGLGFPLNGPFTILGYYT